MKSRLLLLFLLLVPRLAGATVIDDFEREATGIRDTPAAALSLVDAPKSPDGTASGKALAIDWPFPHKTWAACVYAEPKPVPGLGPDTMVAIRLEAWIPAAPSVSHVGLQLLDAHNETFQWINKLSPQNQAGWRTLTFPIDTEKSSGHWGGTNGGRVGYPLRLLGFSVVFANDKVPAGRVLIDGLRADPMPSVTLETDRFPYTVNPTGDAKCDLVIANAEDRAIELTMNGTLTQFSGATNEVAGQATLPAHGRARLPLALADRRPGIRWLDCVLRFDNSEVTYKTSFTISDPVERAGGPGNFLFGICSHTESQPIEEQALEMQAAAAAGATIMRTGVPWARIEPKPGDWHWEVQDRLVDLAARNGIETQPILGFPPSHAASEELRAAQTAAYKNHDPNAWKIILFGPPEEAPWRRYVAEIAKRYQGRIRYYEVWNEPDLTFWRGTTDEYLRVLRAAYEELHRADPKAQLMTGGFATVLEHAARAKNPNLQERVLAEASDSFDIHAVHQHGPFGEYKGAVDGELKRIRAKMTIPRPLYFNETAFSSAYGGEKLQATTLVKKLTYAMAQGAIGYNWYDLRNDGTNPAEGEHNYGLLNDRFHPKASFAVYSELVRQLHGAHFLGNLDLGPDREAHVFGSDRGRVLVWWNEGANTGEIPVLLHAGNGPVRAVDLMGNAHELAQMDGMVLAQPASEPQYLVFPPDKQPPAMAALLVRLAGPTEAAVGQPLHLTAQLANPFAHVVNLDLSWLDSAGKEIKQTVALAAHGSQQLPIVTKAASPRSLVHGMDLHYAVQGTPWAGVTRYAVPVGRLIGDASPENRAPDWVLDSRADLVSFTDADPALAVLNWKGPDDLSARVWLWRIGGVLHIRVDARDDVHVQKETADASWRADGLQIGFQIPGEKDYWEIGVAQAEDGTMLRAAWITPAGVKGAVDNIGASGVPIPGGLRYEVTLPCDRFGLTDAALAHGLRFNLIVNDNDGNLRKQFVRIAPGIGEVKDPKTFALVHFAGVEGGP